MYPPLFDGVLGAGATKYIGIPMGLNTLLGLQIAKKAAGAVTFTIELTEFGADKAPVETAGTYQWKDSGEVIADPAAGTSTVLQLGNFGNARARLKCVDGGSGAQIEVRASRKL